MTISTESDCPIWEIETRPSDSPVIESIWRSYSNRAGPFVSVAVSRFEMVISKVDGEITCTWRGPETQPSVAQCPPDGEWLGIQFRNGVFMPHLQTDALVNNAITFPQAAVNSFWLHGSGWEIPNFDNIETFVARLINDELLVYDSLIASALKGQATDVSPRTLERRFVRSTGLTHGTISQIERAVWATTLLLRGASILDTVELAGFADQPHLTRSLKRFIGQTPTRLGVDSNPMPMSIETTLTNISCLLPSSIADADNSGAS